MNANFNTNSAAVTDKFIVDYKNADGQDYHQCFAIFGVPNILPAITNLIYKDPQKTQN